MERILPLEMVRVTEAAALAAAELMGRGDEDAADEAAVPRARALARHDQQNGGARRLSQFFDRRDIS